MNVKKVLEELKKENYTELGKYYELINNKVIEESLDFIDFTLELNEVHYKEKSFDKGLLYLNFIFNKELSISVRLCHEKEDKVFKLGYKDSFSENMFRLYLAYGYLNFETVTKILNIPIIKDFINDFNKSDVIINGSPYFIKFINEPKRKTEIVKLRKFKALK